MGVVGAGRMGLNHLRILSEMDSVDLMGVFDSDSSKSETAARTFGCGVFSSLAALGDAIDAAVVVVPSAELAGTGLYLLEAGIHCLVEKPFATTPEEGKALVDCAERNALIVMPGFIERFNPAVRALRDVLASQPGLRALESRRMSALSSRIQDVDVILDLLVHDLDIALSIMDHEIVDIAARGMTMHSDVGADYIIAALSFSDGSIANLVASRITHNKIRSLQISTERCMIDLDYITQQLRISRQSDIPQLVDGRSGNYKLDLAVDQVLVTPTEPLMLELRHFVDCVRNRTAPEVTGEDALRTLDVAWRIERSLKVSERVS